MFTNTKGTGTRLPASPCLPNTRPHTVALTPSPMTWHSLLTVYNTRTRHPPPTLNRTPELYGLQPTSCRPYRPSLSSRAGFFQPEPRSAPSTAISGNRCLTRLLLPIIYLFLLLFPLRPSCQRRAAVRRQRKAEAAGRAGSGAKRRERGTPRHPCLLTLEDHEHWAGGQER